ncbi:MAG: D-alanyl-D-alanine carboxypeptidase [Gammaproteobacteria bacterium]|jgi:serine-type D-Ala-D-Ala carboxypeptidase (penicillin-binding protein 5/6)|nr:D-alanyl-D-alanine carboxypeptidase [Gammaproteobacteria bacterium]
MTFQRTALYLLLVLILSPIMAIAQVPSAPALTAKGYLLLDHNSGRVLAEKSSTERMEPASITKLMTAYVAFNAIKNGQINIDDEVLISEKAWRTPGSRMFIEVGTRVSVDLLLQGMIIQSGNDASVAIAEHVAGTEATFAELMNQTAQNVGMLNSNYMNSTGLPDADHFTTASDIAMLANAIIRDFPEYYAWYSQKQFTYNGITQDNRNALLWRDPSVDGLKTGYTEAAGYCLVSSAKREDTRLISVILGTNSSSARANDSQALLNYGFRFFETRRLYSADQKVAEERVWYGNPETVSLVTKEDVYITIPRGSYDNLVATTSIPAKLEAPLSKQTLVGNLNITLNGKQVAGIGLYPETNIEETGLFGQLLDWIMLFFE